jgi:hypothetical protein
MIALSDRLMQFSADHAPQIAEQWYKALSANPKTRSYRLMKKEVCVRHAENIYKNLNQLFFADNCENAVANFLDMDGFVEEHYARGIPLDQMIYAVILLRRHLWLYAESQSLYNGFEDMMQMIDNVNRVLLVFDYFIFTSASQYHLIQAKLGESKIVSPHG